MEQRLMLRSDLCWGLSNGKQMGPRIGTEKGPLSGVGAGLSR
jgi:hypothetical protein